MDVQNIPLFSLLKDRLGYLNRRQQLIAENVANSDTPDFMARDLKPFKLQDGNPSAANLKLTDEGFAITTSAGPVQTNARHLPGMRVLSSTGGKPMNYKDTEVSLDGNKVVLEEQMMKLTDTRANYDAAMGFYQKSLGMLRSAARAPGR
jgi:flagellar basal-body rod protein FlgB